MTDKFTLSDGEEAGLRALAHLPTVGNGLLQWDYDLSVARAKAWQHAERRQLEQETGLVFEGDFLRQRPDPLRLALAISNFIAASAFGPQGEFRCQK